MMLTFSSQSEDIVIEERQKAVSMKQVLPFTARPESGISPTSYFQIKKDLSFSKCPNPLRNRSEQGFGNSH